MPIRTVLSGLLALGLSAVASSTSAALVIKIDKSAQRLTVSRDGQTLHTWPVSTGKTGYATPSGNFTTFRMEAVHFSKEWDDAPMPHSVFFTEQGHAIHGSYEIRRLGLPVSHGCVRLAPANATKLFALVKREGLSATRVVLTGSEQVALARGKAQQVAGSARRPRDREPSTGPDDDLRIDPPRSRVYVEPRSAPNNMQPEYAQPNPGYQAPYARHQDIYGRPYLNAPPFDR
jgi:hypothetical protein